MVECNYYLYHNADPYNTSDAASLTLFMCAVSACCCSPIHITSLKLIKIVKCLKCRLTHSFLWLLGTKRHTQFSLQESFQCENQVQEVLSFALC